MQSCIAAQAEQRNDEQQVHEASCNMGKETDESQDD